MGEGGMVRCERHTTLGPDVTSQIEADTEIV
jgi:hypothetical protein